MASKDNSFLDQLVNGLGNPKGNLGSWQHAARTFQDDYFSPRVKIVLSYVPSAVFPAIIFPAVFLNSTGQLVFLDNPKVLAAMVAVLVGYLTESVIATILTGLGVLWLLIFFI